jgi:hypothetical protein
MIRPRQAHANKQLAEIPPIDRHARKRAAVAILCPPANLDPDFARAIERRLCEAHRRAVEAVRSVPFVPEASSTPDITRSDFRLSFGAGEVTCLTMTSLATLRRKL